MASRRSSVFELVIRENQRIALRMRGTDLDSMLGTIKFKLFGKQNKRR